MGEKKKNIAVKIVAVPVMLFIIVVCATPYIQLEPGTFIGESLKGLHSLFVSYLGFFSSEELQTITLLPLAVFCFMLILEILFSVDFVFIFFETVVFLGFYIVSAYIQGGGAYFESIAFLPNQNWQYVGFVMVFVALASLVFLSMKEIEASKKNNPNKNKVEDIEKESEVIERVAFDPKVYDDNLTSEQALASLENVAVPEFQMFSNYTQDSAIGSIASGSDYNSDNVLTSSVDTGIYAVASMEGNLHREAKKLSDMFRPRNITRKLQEEAAMKEVFSDFSSDLNFDLETQNEEEPVIEKPVEEKPVFNKVIERNDQPIVDEGSEGEETPEEAAEKYRRMTEANRENVDANGNNIDFVSGVGGLRSSADGSYVYDSSKYRYEFPSEALLKHYEVGERRTVDLAHDNDGQTIVDTLAQFKIETQLIDIQHGPTFTLYELALARGIRVNTVLNLADNIAMDLAVQSVRILAPIPGKSAIGIEVPNRKRDTIGFDLMMPALKAKTLKVPMVLGRTITGESIVIDLAGTPHLLIAGTTGSGKSVCVNSLICSILYTKTPREVRMLLVDPKMVELSVYNDIPHLLTPVITDSKKTIKAMAFIVEEMERRMSMFSMIGARKIEDYNAKIKEKAYLRAQLPYIVVVIDEFADLMLAVGKELESYIKRITAMARFTGIHLVLATQRPSADVITGVIKSNIPTQIAFAVSNRTNSQIILDTGGAEKLLGKGDMLYQSASNRVPQRIQGAYIDPEIEDIVNFVKTQGEPDYIDEAYFEDDEDDESSEEDVSVLSGGEDMYMRAWKIVADRGEASASYLQRRLSIGYNRAANLIEELEANGCIGPAHGSKPREILRYPDSRSEQEQI